MKGSNNHRVVALVLFASLLCLALVSCDQRGGKTSTTSGVFFAPVGIPTNDVGVNPNTGEKRVEAIFDKLAVLKAVNPGELGSELESRTPETLVLGKFSEPEFVLFESESGTLLKADISKSDPLDPNDPGTTVSAIELSQIFITPRASFEPDTVLTLFDGVVFGYETTTRSLFVVRKLENGLMSVQVLITRNEIQAQIGRQTFNFIFATQLDTPDDLAVGPDGTRTAEIALMSSPTGIEDQDIQLFIIEQDVDGNISGRFRDFPLVTLDSVRDATDTFAIDVFDFRPILIPDSQSFLLFDSTTSNFVQVDIERDGVGNIVGTTAVLFTQFGEVQFVVQQGSPGFTQLDLTIRNAFVLPNSPEIIVFEEQTNNMLSLSYAAPPGTVRVGVFAPSSNLLGRRDFQGDVEDADFARQDPVLSFAEGAVRTENVLVFDQGNDELLALNFLEGQYVVVLKQVDLARETGLSGISDLTFMEPVTDSETLAFDTQGNALLRIRMEYVAFPIGVNSTKTGL